MHDRYFDPATSRISSYFCQLFILIGSDRLQFCIRDTDKNKFIALADFRFYASEKLPEKLYAQIDAIISGEELLRKKYPSVIVGVDTSYHTLVPVSLFDKDQIGKYLEFNFRVPADYHYIADRVEEIDAVNIAAIPKKLEEFIMGYYGKAAIIHGSTAVLRAAYMNSKDSEVRFPLILYAGSHYIDLALFDGNKPVLFNSFPVKTKEDVLYFTLFVIEQASLRPEQVRLFLGGMIKPDSDYYLLLAEYLNNISFLARLGTFNYSPLLEQLPSHFYQDLFAIALCGS